MTHRIAMASCKVKCSHCNIVICEILAFIQNKVDVMDEESIVRICSTSFLAEDIEQAKSLLFESLTIKKRKVTRKRDGRSQRDLYDVIAVFKETDPEGIPIFVARELQKLPPVTFDHIDATRLLKDILVIQSDLKTLKETYVSSDQLNEVKNDLFHLKQTLTVNNYERLNINTKRDGGGIYNSNCNMDSGPTGLPHIGERNLTHNTAVNTLSNKICLESTLAQAPISDEPISLAQVSCTNEKRHVEVNDNNMVSNIESTPAPERRVHLIANDDAGMNHQTSSTPVIDKTLAQIVSTDRQWQNDKQSEEWTLLQRKRLRNRLSTIEGKALNNPNEKFKAADIRIPLFLNNVDIHTSDSDIIKYILNKTKVNVSLQKINTKIRRQYNAYKICVPKTKLTLFLEGSLWPEGVSIRRFVEYKDNNINGRQTTKYHE